MPKPQEIKVLTFGEKTFAVESLSPQIQALVEQYNYMSVKEEGLRVDVYTLMLAKEQCKRQIEEVYLREQQELAKKNAEAVAQTPAPPAE